MRHLIAIAYNDIVPAEETRLKMLSMHRDYLLQLEDIVIAVKNQEGKVKLNQAVNLPIAGAAQGSFLGMLVGLLFLNPLLGVVVGAASGAAMGALADIGIEDDMMKEMAEQLQPGGALLFALAHDVNVDRVIEDLAGAGGRVIKTTLRHEDELELQNALQNAYRQTEVSNL